MKVSGQSITLTHPDKVLFPEAGYTKRDLAEYYRAVARAMLPHLRGRPLILHRFPSGVGQEGFIQQAVSSHFPAFVHRVTVERERGGMITHPTAENAATLVYLAGQNTLALHAWSSREPSLREPDRLIFDLDPPDGRFDLARHAALELRDILEALGGKPFAKVTGSSGLHVVAALGPGAGFDEVRELAASIAEHLAEKRPDLYTTGERLEHRDGRLYLDIKRNSYGATAVAPYSVRALEGAPVAAPLTWDEVALPETGPRMHNIETIPPRLERLGDPWAELGKNPVGLAALRARWNRLQAGL